MAETEVERIVVRLVGDSSNYKQMLDKAQTTTKQAASQIQAAGGSIATAIKPGEKALGGMSISADQAKKSLDLVGRFGGIPSEALGTIQQGGDALKLTGAAAKGLVGELGLMKGALAATGVGLLIVGVAALVSKFAAMNEETNKLNASAKAAFGSIASGARTAAQAMADVRVNTLTEGFNEVVETAADMANPGFFSNIWRGLRSGSLQAVVGMRSEADIATTRAGTEAQTIVDLIDRVRTRAASAQDLVRRMQADPAFQRLQRGIAIDRGASQATDTATSMRDEVARLGMSEDAARRYAMAQELAAKANISLREATQHLAPQLASIQESQRRIAGQRVVDVGRDMQEEVDRIGMGADEARRYGLAQQFARQTGIELTEALRQLGPALDDIQSSQDQLAASRIFEETRTPMEQFKTRTQELDRLLDAGALQLDTYSRAVNKAEKDLLGAADATDKFNQATAGSADALARIGDYQARMSRMKLPGSEAGSVIERARTRTASQNPTAPVVVVATPPPSPQIAQTNNLLGSMRDFLRDIANRPRTEIEPF